MFRRVIKIIVRLIEFADSVIGLLPFLITIWITIGIFLSKQNLLVLNIFIMSTFIIYLIFKNIKYNIKKSNRGLHVKEYKVTHTVKNDERLHSIRVRFSSLRGNIRAWIYRLNWTGSEKPSLKLHTKDCRLFGPITEDFDWIHYRIEFKKQLSKTKDQFVNLEIQLPDPHKTSKPIISSRFDQFGKCGKFSLTVKFDCQPLPHAVYFNIFSLNGSIPLKTDPLEIIQNNGNCIVVKEINKIDQNKRYVVNWSY